MAKKVLTHNLSEPLGEIRTARFDINTGTGNLTVDRLASGEGLLASGALEYLEKQDPPAWTVKARDGQATLTLKANGGRQPGFRLPWQGCNGATDWQIHLNPHVSADITAHSGGGNVRLDIAGMALTRLSADTGGGNVEVILPDNASDLDVTAKTGGGTVSVEIGRSLTGSSTVFAESGAGNVSIFVPAEITARVHAASGLGKVVVDARYDKVAGNMYQSPGFDGAADKVEITAKSGAGNVSIL